MITFKQFISEQEANSFANLILKNCKPFLEATNGNGLLLRGVKKLENAVPHTVLDAEGNEMEYAVKTVRQDRKPLDITVNRSRMIDDWFDEKFGIRARSECVFAIGEKVNPDDLKFYGKPCVIFPIGEIKYVWSQNVQDLYSDIDLYTDNMTQIRNDVELEERIRKWLDERKYRNDNLEEAVQMKHEVMIKCGSYYAFPIEYMEQIKRALGIR